MEWLKIYLEERLEFLNDVGNYVLTWKTDNIREIRRARRFLEWLQKERDRLKKLVMLYIEWEKTKDPELEQKIMETFIRGARETPPKAP